MQEGKEIKAFVFGCFLTYGLQYQKIITRLRIAICPNIPSHYSSIYKDIDHADHLNFRSIKDKIASIFCRGNKWVY